MVGHAHAFIFALLLRLTHGVTVALQILVLSVKVRILMGQRILLVIELRSLDKIEGLFYLQGCCSAANPLGQQNLLVKTLSPRLNRGLFVSLGLLFNFPV